jgi:hypothetical protein
MDKVVEKKGLKIPERAHREQIACFSKIMDVNLAKNEGRTKYQKGVDFLNVYYGNFISETNFEVAGIS